MIVKGDEHDQGSVPVPVHVNDQGSDHADGYVHGYGGRELVAG
jgi:hypothetical protein